MKKEKMIGFIMLALVIAITGLYFIFNGQVKNLEDENSRLREAVATNESEKNFSTTENEESNNEKDTENETNESIQEEETTDESSESNTETVDDSTLQNGLNQLNEYDEFISSFINQIFASNDVEEQRTQLNEMTTDNAYQYLLENYYVLGEIDENEFSDAPEGTAMEGSYESLELDAEVRSLQTFYTFNGESIETIALFQLVTDAGEETFSGNFILNADIAQTENGLQITNVKSITAFNEPNADQLFAQ